MSERRHLRVLVPFVPPLRPGKTLPVLRAEGAKEEAVAGGEGNAGVFSTDAPLQCYNLLIVFP